MLHQGCVPWVSHERKEYSVSAARAAASARKEKCASSSKGSSSLLADLAQILPALGSANRAHSVNSKATGITNRISNTSCSVQLAFLGYLSSLCVCFRVSSSGFTNPCIKFTLLKYLAGFLFILIALYVVTIS